MVADIFDGANRIVVVVAKNCGAIKNMDIIHPGEFLCLSSGPVFAGYTVDIEIFVNQRSTQLCVLVGNDYPRAIIRCADRGH